MKQVGIAGLAMAAVGAAVIGVATLGRGSDAGHPAASGPEVYVYKTATCGCCAKWVDHLRENGFQVEVENVRDLIAIKERHGVPSDLGSCHTALVEGKVVEGHVPASAIRAFLDDPPENALGIAVPGMPIGSPGMEGRNPSPYDVLVFDGDAGRSVFERIEPGL